jgi:iron complex outermembrane receptor protein
VWADKGLTTNKKWYDLDADKNDFNIYLKQQTTVAKHLHLFYDMQYRHVIYSMEGFRNNPTLAVQNRYHFFNPKAGISYVKNGWKTYLSFGVANKEPNRDDFEAGASTRPLPEKLYNVEYGIEQKKANYNWAATIFFMDYKNQLVLTGKINDVGAYTRTNIAKSYRAGVELEGTYQLSTKWNAAANIALSQNKVKDFIEYIDDYDNGLQQTIPYTRTDIAYSPNLIGALTINYVPVKKLELSFMNKYVGKQYLDNTSNDSRSLNSFTIQDVKISYTLGYKWLKEVNLIGQVNNVFNTKYEPNGYTFSYIAGGHTTTENFYFPMAGINFMLGINVRM